MRLFFRIGFCLLGLAFTLMAAAGYLDTAVSRGVMPLGRNPLFELINKNPSNPLMHRGPSYGHFALRKGDAFKLRQADRKGFRFNEIAFSLLFHPGDVQEVCFRAGTETSYILRLSADAGVPSGFFYLGPNRKREPLEGLAEMDRPWMPPLGNWLKCRLYLSGNQFSLALGEAGPFSFSDDRLADGSVVFRTLEGGPFLDDVAYEALERGKTVLRSETFENQGIWGDPDSPRLLIAGMLLWAILIFGYAAWLSLPGRLGFRFALWRVLSFFIAGLPFAVLVIYIPVIFYYCIPLVWMAATPFLLGMFWGLIHLPRLRFSKVRLRPGFSRPVRLFATMAVVLGLLGLLLAATAPVLEERLSWEAGRAPENPDEETSLPKPLEKAGPIPLDLSNLWAGGSFNPRDFVLRGEIRLAPESLAEICFRGVARADWNGLQITTLAGVGCQWCDATPLTFEQFQGGALEPIPPEKWIPFGIEVRGCRLQAQVNGRSLPDRIDGSRGEGTLRAMVQKGEGALRNLKVTPLSPQIEGMPFTYRAGHTFWLGGLLAFFSVAGVVLSGGGRRLPLLHFLAMDALAHLPLLAAGFALCLGLFLDAKAIGICAVVMVLGRVAPIIANGALIGKWALLPGMLFPVAAGVVAWLGLQAPQTLEYRVNTLQIFDFTPPVHGDLLWHQMPKLRRSNLYVRNHQFRDRFFRMTRDPETYRIACMGGSSTFGHLMPLRGGWDFPTVMKEFLMERYPNRKWEVMNAGIRGGDALTVREFFGGVVRHFEPDLLIINLFYNDAYIQTLIDEHDYIERLRARSFQRSFVQRVMEELHFYRAVLRYRRFSNLDGRGDDASKAFFERGAESFKYLVRDTVRMARAKGTAVLLVKEPFNGGRGGQNFEAFYAALDEVGSMEGVPVVEPLAAFKQRKAPVKSLYLDAVHFNRSGNRVMADFLVKECERLGLFGGKK